MRFLCVVLTACLLLGSAHAQDADVPFDASRFSNLPAEHVALLQQYYDAYIQLKRFYQTIVISGQQAEYRRPRASNELPIESEAKGLELAYIADFQYWCREGKYYRLDGTFLDLKDETTPTRAQTGIIRPDESFSLGYDLQTRKHFLKAHGKNREEYLGLLRSYVFPIAPFSEDVLLLEYKIFYNRPNSTVVSAQLDAENPEEAVITVKSGTAEFGATSTIHLSPAQRWAVRRIEHDYIGSRSSSGEINQDATGRNVQVNEYDGDINGFPLLKSVRLETWSVPKDDSEPTLAYRQFTEIHSITAEPPDLKVFDVEQLVPKFDRVGEQRSPGTVRWVLAINGIVLLLIGVLLSRWAKSRRGSSSHGVLVSSAPCRIRRGRTYVAAQSVRRALATGAILCRCVALRGVGTVGSERFAGYAASEGER